MDYYEKRIPPHIREEVMSDGDYQELKRLMFSIAGWAITGFLTSATLAYAPYHMRADRLEWAKSELGESPQAASLCARLNARYGRDPPYTPSSIVSELGLITQNDIDLMRGQEDNDEQGRPE